MEQESRYVKGDQVTFRSSDLSTLLYGKVIGVRFTQAEVFYTIETEDHVHQDIDGGRLI